MAFIGCTNELPNPCQTSKSVFLGYLGTFFFFDLSETEQLVFVFGG